jgi:hypothetical protein
MSKSWGEYMRGLLPSAATSRFIWYYLVPPLCMCFVYCAVTRNVDYLCGFVWPFKDLCLSIWHNWTLLLSLVHYVTWLCFTIYYCKLVHREIAERVMRTGDVRTSAVLGMWHFLVPFMLGLPSIFKNAWETTIQRSICLVVWWLFHTWIISVFPGIFAAQLTMLNREVTFYRRCCERFMPNTPTETAAEKAARINMIYHLQELPTTFVWKEYTRILKTYSKQYNDLKDWDRKIARSQQGHGNESEEELRKHSEDTKIILTNLHTFRFVFYSTARGRACVCLLLALVYVVCVWGCLPFWQWWARLSPAAAAAQLPRWKPA